MASGPELAPEPDLTQTQHIQRHGQVQEGGRHCYSEGDVRARVAEAQPAHHTGKNVVPVRFSTAHDGVLREHCQQHREAVG